MKLKALIEPFYWPMMRLAAHVGAIQCALPLELPNKAAVDKLPEGQRALYVEDGGKFKLDVDGLPDTSTLEQSLTSERAKTKAEERRRKELEKKYEGIDVEKVRELMGHFENAEEAELLKKGKEGIDLIIGKRTEKMRNDFQKKLDEAGTQVKGAQEVARTFMDIVLDHQIMQAAVKAGVHEHALKDVTLRARSIFDIDDNGNAVRYEEDGETIVKGKDAKTAYSPAEWIEEQRQDSPHWFPANASGGGASGSRGHGHHGAKTMKRAAFEQLPPADQHDFTVNQKGVVVD